MKIKTPRIWINALRTCNSGKLSCIPGITTVRKTLLSSLVRVNLMGWHTQCILDTRRICSCLPITLVNAEGMLTVQELLAAAWITPSAI
jgi:hypothetical protein